MLRALIDCKLPDDLPTETGLREHPPHGLLHRERRTLGQQLVVSDTADAAGEARVAVVDLLGLLAPRDANAAGVHHDHVVTGVRMRGEDRLVLASE